MKFITFSLMITYTRYSIVASYIKVYWSSSLTLLQEIKLLDENICITARWNLKLHLIIAKHTSSLHLVTIACSPNQIKTG